MIRLAEEKDIERVSEIYEKIHDAEDRGESTSNWLRGVYPTKETALKALKDEELFVLLEDDVVVGSAIINQRQVEGAYEYATWHIDAEKIEVMVLHTLTIDPDEKGKGYAKAFVSFYESYAKEKGCKDLRMDTNTKNTIARALYKKLGYVEIGEVDTTFNGIAGVRLVLLEKGL